MRQLQSPLATSAPPTPTTPVAPFAGNKGIPGSLEGTIAPADMLNVLSAHRESVNTADGKMMDFQKQKTSSGVNKFMSKILYHLPHLL